MALPLDGRFRNPDGASQPTLLTLVGLADSQCSVSWSRKDEIRGRKERRQDVKKLVTHRDRAAQLQFTGVLVKRHNHPGGTEKG